MVNSIVNITRTENENKDCRYLIFISICACFLSFQIEAATHYVDASCVGCDDTFVVDDQSNPYQSLTRINQVMNSGSILSGDIVSLKRGERWRESLIITQSNVTFNAYGDAALNNPLIIRTDNQVGWSQYSEYLQNGGFEEFTKPFDVSNPWLIWRESPTTNTTIEVDNTNSVRGQASAKINRPVDSTGKPLLRFTKNGLTGLTDYYLRFYTKTSGSAELEVAIRNRRSDGSDEWLQTDGMQWGEGFSSVISISGGNSSDWQPIPLSFKTPANPEQIEVWFRVVSGDGSIWLDEVIFVGGTVEPVTKVWVASTDGQKVYGMLKNNIRISTDDPFDLSGVSSLVDGHAAYFGGHLYYRSDTGDLSLTEIGKRFNAITVNSQSNIVIDSIDVMGPGAREEGIQPHPTNADTGNALIFVLPGSADINVKNLSAFQASGTGISAGIFKDSNNPINVVYDNLQSYGHESTALYIRGSGEVKNSTVYDISTAAGDTGDGGGIGLQDGPVLVTGNEIHSIGSEDRKLDFAISICCSEGGLNPNGLNGAFVVSNNYIHDISNGGIQIAGNSGAYPHLINNNIINRYGISQYSGPLSTGSFAGVRIRNAPNTKIFNNVLANGSAHVQAMGILLVGDAQKLNIKNNIFYDLESNNIAAGTINGVYADVSEWQIDNNIYFRATNANKWKWASLTFDSLAQWQDYWLSEQDIGSDILSPNFVNSALTEIEMFALSANSNAIDKGVDVGLFLDYIGNPLLGAPDIGAYEYGSSDTDGDGVIDYDERCHDGDCSTYDPYNTETNISGGDLDVNVADTDGDGFNDGYELAAESNPLDAFDIPALGDVNNDGVINAADALLVVRITLGSYSPTAGEIIRADVAPLISGASSPDGQINVGDLVVIFKLVTL